MARTGAGVRVLIRPDAPGRSICTMSYGVSPIGDATPDQYQQMLASDEGHRDPGVRFDVVTTWQTRIDAAVAVGAYNLIEHSGSNRTASESRTLFCVFPDGSADAVELSFTTLEADQFDDFVAQTKACVSTLVVVLEN